MTPTYYTPAQVRELVRTAYEEGAWAGMQSGDDMDVDCASSNYITKFLGDQ